MKTRIFNFFIGLILGFIIYFIILEPTLKKVGKKQTISF